MTIVNLAGGNLAAAVHQAVDRERWRALVNGQKIFCKCNANAAKEEEEDWWAPPKGPCLIEAFSISDYRSITPSKFLIDFDVIS